MKPFSSFLSSLVCIFFLQFGIAQDSLLVKLASEHLKKFEPELTKFKGEGWDHIKKEVVKAQNVLVGEEHFSNEIPMFVKALFEVDAFDNFYIEVDPYSVEIITRSLTTLSDNSLLDFNQQYGELFSFYSLEPEYELLQHIANKGINIMGSDQVVAYADRLIFQDLITKTKNTAAINSYMKIVEQSRLELERFHEVTRNPMTMYFMTAEFMEDLKALETLDLSEKEYAIIADIKRSIAIYKEQNHKERVRLILNGLMNDYPKWKNSKNLFKYGANHMARGESLLGNYDIGNMVANITESNYKESFHIMIVGESGALGSIFKSFPTKPVDAENGFYLKHLKPFFKLTEGNQWHLFDLVPLREMIERGKLEVANLNLERTIKGFDVLVIIPEVTPAEIMTISNEK